MSSAIEGSISLAAYLALFASVGFIFVFFNLLVGRFFRPHNPHEEKGEIYECGEPTIGSSFVQFDLRFYVVALIFIIFDVEVAFLFPWATVFGKATHLMNSEAVVAAVDGGLGSDAIGVYQELGVRAPSVVNQLVAESGSVVDAVRDNAATLMTLAAVEVLVFFAILLVAYAYEWHLGALDWIRAMVEERRQSGTSPDDSNTASATEPVMSA